MTNLIKKVKVKKQDGTFTDYIPIGAEAKNVKMNNDYSVQENIGNIDIENDGNINEQLENNALLINNINNNKGKVISGSSEYSVFLTNDDYLITITYSGSHPYLAVSKNGEEWNKVFFLPQDMVYPESYDFSITYLNGYFYICYDVKDREYNHYSELPQGIFKGGNRIGITKTKDFIKYEKWIVDVDTQFKQVWAPEWFIDNGNVYLTANVATGTETYVITSESSTVFMHRCFLFTLDSTYKNITNSVEILPSYEHPVIDPYLFKENGNYYLFIKDEDQNTILQFKNSSIMFSSNNLINDIKVYNTMNKIQGIEGPAVIKFNGLYYLYADSYSQSHATKLFLTNDIEKWYNVNTCNSVNSMYHFTPYIINSTTLKNLMIDIFNKNGYPVLINNHYDRIDYIVPQESEYDIFFALNNRKYVFMHGLEGGLTINSINMDLIKSNGTFKILSMSKITKPLIIKNVRDNSSYKVAQEFYNDIVLQMRDSFECYVSATIESYGEIYSGITNNSIFGKVSITTAANTKKLSTINFPQTINEARIQAILLTPLISYSNLDSDIKYVVDSYSSTGFKIGVKTSTAMTLDFYYYVMIR